MFRLIFLVVFFLLIWLESLFTETVEVVEGDVHIFKYNWIP